MRVCKSALALCLTAVLGSAHAADQKVAKWVDSNGVTHFGDVQFAPATAVQLDLAPTNGMSVPANVPASGYRSGPVWTVIDQAPKQNRIGWRSSGQAPKSGPISPSHR